MTQLALALIQELENSETSDARRKQIGEQLAEMGDLRAGVNVKDGLPDIVWLPVESAKVEVIRVWYPETPDEEFKILHRQQFEIDAFYVAKYLVTYAQYQAFVEAQDGFENLTWWEDIPQAYQRQKLYQQRTAIMNHPRDTISWYQSLAFARWMNHRLEDYELPHPSGNGLLRVGDNSEVRLPTEWEWQAAAQNGSEARPYPWGENKSGYANTAEAQLKQSLAVGMYPQGASACGACDMAGNLMEWCTNDKEKIEITDISNTAPRALRGGDWAGSIENASCTYCDGEAPAALDPLNGFRLILGQVY